MPKNQCRVMRVKGMYVKSFLKASFIVNELNFARSHFTLTQPYIMIIRMGNL